jgi:hypothetical protein
MTTSSASGWLQSMAKACTPTMETAGVFGEGVEKEWRLLEKIWRACENGGIFSLRIAEEGSQAWVESKILPIFDKLMLNHQRPKLPQAGKVHSGSLEEEPSSIPFPCPSCLCVQGY